MTTTAAPELTITVRVTSENLTPAEIRDLPAAITARLGEVYVADESGGTGPCALEVLSVMSE